MSSWWLQNPDSDGCRKLITITQDTTFLTVGYDIKNDYPSQGYDIDLRIGSTEGSTSIKYNYNGFNMGTDPVITRKFKVTGLSLTEGQQIWIGFGLDPGRPYRMRNFIVDYSGTGTVI